MDLDENRAERVERKLSLILVSFRHELGRKPLLSSSCVNRSASCASSLGQLPARSATFFFNSAHAPITAGATLAVSHDPPLFGASGNCESPSSKRTFSIGIPSASAANCVIASVVAGCRSRASRCAMTAIPSRPKNRGRSWPVAVPLDKSPSPSPTLLACRRLLASILVFDSASTNQIFGRHVRNIRAASCSTTVCFRSHRAQHNCAHENPADRYRLCMRVRPSHIPMQKRPALHPARASDTAWSGSPS